MNRYLVTLSALGASAIGGTLLTAGLFFWTVTDCPAASKNTALVVSGTALGNVNIVDGDTIHIDGLKIRIVEIDTPETYRSRCENELKLGLAAKERLRALLNAGPVTYEATGTDRYRRTLARVYAGGVNVGEQLIAEGFALRYRPGGAAKLARLQAWCGPAAKLDW